MALPPLGTIKKLDAKAKPDSKEYKEAEAALKKGYATAYKAVSMLGLNMTKKEPLAAKILPLMQKEGKQAEYELAYDKGKVSLQIVIGSNKSVLGLYDLAAERDLEIRRTQLEGCVHAGIAEKKELEEFNKKYPPGGGSTGPDAKVLANLAKMKADYAGLNYEKAKKLPKIYAEIRGLAAKRHADEGFQFEDAIFRKAKPEDILAEFIVPDAPNEINIASSLKAPLLKAAKEGTLSLASFKPAYDVVKNLIETNDISMYAKAKVEEIDKQIAAEKKKK